MDSQINSDGRTLKTAPAGGVREVWRIAAPIIVSMASFCAMQFADRAFLAQYGELEFRASLPAGALSLTLIMFFQALAGYSTTFVSQYHGAKQSRMCARSTGQGIWLALLSWPFLPLLLLAGFALLGLAGHDAELLAAEKKYFAILMLGGGIVSLAHVYGGFFSGRGRPQTPMMANLIGNIVNIVMDYALIFGRFGFPRMGIAGAAIATLIGTAVAVGILAFLYYSEKYQATFATRQEWRLHMPLLWRIVRFGLPSAVHSTLDIASFALFTILLARLPPADVVASNIAFSVNNLAFMPLLGLGMAATIVVGQYQGARRSADAARATYSTLYMAWAYTGFLCVTFFAFPEFYFKLFTGSAPGKMPMEQVIQTGRILLIMMGCWGLFDATNLVIGGTLKGAGDTRFVLWFSLISNWVFWLLPEIIWLVYLDGGLIPAWLWMTLYTVFLAGGFWWRFKRGRWRAIEMVESTPVSTAEVVP